MLPATYGGLTGRLAGVLLLWFCWSAAVLADDEPRLLAEDLADRMFDALAEHQGAPARDPALLHRLADEILVPHVDFDRMSRWVLDREWLTASDTQRAAFQEQFRRLLVGTYSSALLQTDRDHVLFLPSRHLDHGRVVVRSQVTFFSGAQVSIEFPFARREGRWLAYDLVIDGVSLVSNYRSSFASQLRRGNLDQLIARMMAQPVAAGAPVLQSGS